ncbi:MAG: glycosyltransferase, partial [Nitrososphaeraceae archaeon]
MGFQKQDNKKYDIAQLESPKDEQSNQTKSKVVVIIPAYNEAHIIEDIIRKTKELSTLVIVVDDGSNDGTLEVCRSMNVKVIRNSRRMGKGIA